MNFRRYVLKQNPKEDCYQLSTAESGVKRKLTVDEIKANVIKLVNHAFTIQPVKDSTEDQPILTGKRVEHCLGEDGEMKWWKVIVISQVIVVVAVGAPLFAYVQN